MNLRVMMIGPYPRLLRRIDGGVAAATTYLSQALAQDPDISLCGVMLGGRARTAGPTESLGWPVERLELERLSVSSLFRRQQRRLATMIRQFRPDVLHAQGADAAGYLALRSGVPSIVTIHGILTECAKLNSNRVAALRELFQARITEHFVVERASHVISISPYVARYYQGRLGGVLHDIPNAVAPTFFSVQRAPVRGRILFAGRISKGKGVLDLVAAAAQDRHALDSLVLAGHIPDARFAEELTAVAKAGGIADRLKLTGLLDEEALLREFAHASVLVLPSYQETAPMVIQQAMAAGLPVIATRVGGIPDLINDGESGLLFEPGDISALSLQLGRIASEEGLAARLAANGARVAAAKFSASSVAAATKRAYARVIHGKDAPSGIS